MRHRASCLNCLLALSLCTPLAGQQAPQATQNADPAAQAAQARADLEAKILADLERHRQAEATLVAAECPPPKEADSKRKKRKYNACLINFLRTYQQRIRLQQLLKEQEESAAYSEEEEQLKQSIGKEQASRLADEVDAAANAQSVKSAATVTAPAAPPAATPAPVTKPSGQAPPAPAPAAAAPKSTPASSTPHTPPARKSAHGTQSTSSESLEHAMNEPVATESSQPTDTSLTKVSVPAVVNAGTTSNKPAPAPAPDDGSALNFYGASLAGTQSTCIEGGGPGLNSPQMLRVHRTVMTPQTASDDFGYRLGHRFIVYQVTIENGNKDYQFMLQDISVDFSKSFHAKAGTYRYSASGQDLTMLRGVPEKGEDLDPRNLTLHTLEGIGSVAGAVSGLTPFSDVMGSAIAVFNGSFLEGFKTLAPDHTGTQLNRLSDSAFLANTVIDKQRGKTVALFIPSDEIMNHSDQRDFRSDPNAFLGFAAIPNALNNADICVDGTFIQAVTTAAPTLTSATLETNPAPAAGSPALLDIVGSNLVAGDTGVILSGKTPATAIVVVQEGGKSGTAQVQLPADYVLGTTTATLQSKSNSTLKSSAVVLTVAN